MTKKNIQNSISSQPAVISKLLMHSFPALENTKELGLLIGLYQLHIPHEL